VQRSIDSTSSLVVGRSHSSCSLIRTHASDADTSRRSFLAARFDSHLCGTRRRQRLPISPEQATGRIVVFSAPLGTNGSPSERTQQLPATLLHGFPPRQRSQSSISIFLTQATTNSLRSMPWRSSRLVTRSVDARRHSVVSACRIENLRRGVRQFAPRHPGNSMTREFHSSIVQFECARAKRHCDDTRVRSKASRTDHRNRCAQRSSGTSRCRSRSRFAPRLQSCDATARGAECAQCRRRAVVSHRGILDSLRRVNRPRLESIYNGADDDGRDRLRSSRSRIARVSATSRRSILFVCTQGRSGALGSSWFTDNPTVPRDSIVAQPQHGHGRSRHC